MENIYIYIYLALNYSAQPYIAVHCNKVGKKYPYTFIVAALCYIILLYRDINQWSLLFCCVSP